MGYIDIDNINIDTLVSVRKVNKSQVSGQRLLSIPSMHCKLFGDADDYTFISGKYIVLVPSNKLKISKEEYLKIQDALDKILEDKIV